ncbi:TonB-dependent receptor [Stenotrophomonas sp. ATCM1_4]|jgi:iron complex outermembrane receptor protein|uniref:TonB-dependent receptor n=1 Tax=Stenotrophomonas capsici TaxID=3110230 RepID=A0ABU5V896_9GAMM|nr:MULTISPECIES: TonB-dependent receptor [unclassified Stenotrophomonas]MEA5669588.1 TonB-dependent receptor [Stenotrophomonas sp. MH1]TDB29191.1 TonB-dependent receptor [Stenotrophomonas sp. ATCM1_4]
MRYRKSVLSAAIVTCLSFSAHAQEADKSATDLDRVVVTGIRASLQQSLETKRNADAIVDVITAEDVGKFPATNVAEAMTIIPGVTIDRAYGQGEKVSILGTDPALNRTLLNGQSIASGDWNMSDFPTRTFNYSLLAPELVGKVEVFKSPEARIDEGSIGGTVIVSTRKPLDMPEKVSISGRVSYGRNDRVEKTDPSASAAFAWKNAAENFGFIVSAQASNESIRRDGIESYGTVRAKDYIAGVGGANGSITNLPTDWSVAPNPDGSQPTSPATCVGACADTVYANPDAIGPNSTSAHFFEQERKRKTYSVALQFKPVEQMNIEFNALKIDANFDHMAQSMFTHQGNTWNSLKTLSGLTVKDGLITSASHKNGLVVFDMQNRRAQVDSETYDIKLDWNDERWFASTHIGRTKAEGGPKQVFGEFLARTDYTWSIADAPGKPGSVHFTGANPFQNPDQFQMDGGWGADPNQPSWNTGWGGNLVEKPTTDKETYGQVDFGIKLDSPVYLLRFGYKQRKHETTQIQRGIGLASVAGYGDAKASDFDPRKLPGNYLKGFSGYGDLGNRFTIDGWKLADYITSGDWLAPWQTMPVMSQFSAEEFARNNWSINEDIGAAYLQADFSFDRLRGNIGVRYVRTDLESGSFACNTGLAGCTQAGWSAEKLAASYSPVVVKNKYNNVLPNLNLAYEATDKLVLRFSAAKTIARPNYTDVSSYLWLSDTALTGGGGNPALKPYQSTNLDFSAEWYFSDNAILAGSIFYRDVADYILTESTPEVHWNQNQNKDDTYMVDRPRNAGDAKIKGYSLAWQQNFGYGFGVIANYTYSDGEATGDRPLPFNSKNQFNISPFFENDTWSARVTYGWRDKYFTQVSGGRQLWTMDYASLDASVAFKITDNLSVGLDAMNLLDEEYHSYSGVEQLTRGAYLSGRRYNASLRFNF